MSKKTNTEVVVEAQVEEVVEPTPPSSHTTDVGTGIRKRSSFGKTYYYVDPTRERAKKGPGQLLGIIKWMLDNEITTPEAAMQGAVIGQKAVDDGYVITAKLTGPVIFAYYIRRMENEFGIEHAKTVHAKSGNQMA